MALGITCNNPPVAVIGTAYSHFFPVTGDTPPDVFSISVGALPAGLTIDAGTGEVSGTPLGPTGVSTFTVHVVDSTLATADVECSIRVNATLDVTCGGPPSGSEGSFYSHLFPVTGGVAPFTWSISLGALPTGLTINAATGEVSGIPTTAGLFTFTVHVVDSYGGAAPDSDSVECSILINTNLSITCDNPPVGSVHVAYSHTFPVTGGTAPYTFALAAGMLPPGLTLDAATGILSGSPTIKGVYGFTIEVTDSLDNTAECSCSISIRGKCLLGDVE